MSDAAKFRVVVADDEPLARAGVLDVLAEDPEVEVVARCTDGDEVVEAIRSHRPDILILDVQMPGKDGFGALRDLASESCPTVVFVTAWDEYAIRAFDEGAVDYVLKPFLPARLRAAVDRAKERARSEQSTALLRRLLDRLEGPRGDGDERRVEAPDDPPTREPLQRLAVPKGDRTVVVALDDLDWIEAADYYARLWVGEESHLIRRSLKWFEDRLEPSRFVRVHRSAIVRLDRVAEIRHHGSDDHEAVLTTGATVPLSRAGRALLARHFG